MAQIHQWKEMIIDDNCEQMINLYIKRGTYRIITTIEDVKKMFVSRTTTGGVGI